MRYETIISGPAPESEYDRAKALIESHPEVTALVAKLRNLIGENVTVTTKWIKEVERKAKIVPGNPGGADFSDRDTALIDALRTPAETHAVPGSPHRVRTVARDGEAA